VIHIEKQKMHTDFFKKYLEKVTWVISRGGDECAESI